MALFCGRIFWASSVHCWYNNYINSSRARRKFLQIQVHVCLINHSSPLCVLCHKHQQKVRLARRWMAFFSVKIRAWTTWTTSSNSPGRWAPSSWTSHSSAVLCWIEVQWTWGILSLHASVELHLVRLCLLKQFQHFATLLCQHDFEIAFPWSCLQTSFQTFLNVVLRMTQPTVRRPQGGLGGNVENASIAFLPSKCSSCSPVYNYHYIQSGPCGVTAKEDLREM